jgi:hypothetical protein
MAYKMLKKYVIWQSPGLIGIRNKIYFDLTCTNNARSMSENASS